MSKLANSLVKLGACAEAVEWAAKQKGTRQEMWERCPRADWLLWLAGRVAMHGSPEHRQVVLAACACARTVLHLVPAGEEHPRVAIETAERWARGEDGVTLAMVVATRAAAWEAAGAAAWDAAGAAAWAAAGAAAWAAAGAAAGDAARAAARAAAGAAAGDAAGDAAMAAAWDAAMKSMALIVRKFIPKVPRIVR